MTAGSEGKLYSTSSILLVLNVVLLAYSQLISCFSIWIEIEHVIVTHNCFPPFFSQVDCVQSWMYMFVCLDSGLFFFFPVSFIHFISIHSFRFRIICMCCFHINVVTLYPSPPLSVKRKQSYMFLRIKLGFYCLIDWSYYFSLLFSTPVFYFFIFNLSKHWVLCMCHEFFK